MTRIVVIGGVAGGMSAATRLRRLDADAEIIVVEKSGYVSYANCGLPYYVGGIIEEERDLLLQTPASLHARFRLDVRVSSEVTSISRTEKTVAVTNLLSGETYELKNASAELKKSSQKVTVKGEVRKDVMTLAMIGPVLEVQSFEIDGD